MCGGMYSPRISEDLIPVLFHLARGEDKAMTKVLDEILREELHIRGLIDADQANRNHGRRVKRVFEG